MIEAVRSNNDKPQLSYVLSFKGLNTLLLPAWLDNLARWYRGECAIRDAVREIINASPFAADEAAEAIARVAEFGAAKYARGNYLLGRSWSDTCDSLLRHALAVGGCEERTDPESGLPHWGHILWNTGFLLHCVETMPDRDDRLRPPAPEAAPPVPPPAGATPEASAPPATPPAGAPNGLHGHEPDGTEWCLNEAGDGYSARALDKTRCPGPWVSGNSWQQAVDAARKLVHESND